MSGAFTSFAPVVASGPDAPAPAGADRIAQAWAVLHTVLDPEVPALSLCDLGIVRDVRADPVDGALEVVLTPTYSGCPATEIIAADTVAALDAAGLGPTRTTLQRAPAWSSDWISADGLTKLLAYGIAPPGPVDAHLGVPIRLPNGQMRRPARPLPTPVPCPRCASTQTEVLAAFGATACKALYRCLSCREPFEHFKPI